MKINKYVVLGILLTTFFIGLITTNIFNSNLNSKIEKKEDNIPNEVEKSPLNSDPFIPPPAYPNNQLKWNFTSNTTKAFHWFMSSDEEGAFGTSYYNITSMPYVLNGTGRSDYKFWEYCVEIQELYFNTTYNKLFLNPLNPDLAYVSLLNLTHIYPYFFPKPLLKPDEEEQNPLFLLNTFMPTNGSKGLALNWSAKALLVYYQGLLGGPNILVTVDDFSRNICFLNITTNYYINLTYDSSGILAKGEALFKYNNSIINTIVIVDNDTNPIDEIEWNVKEGDELYYGIGSDEYKFNVSKIVNETHTIPHIGKVVVQAVWANISQWVFNQTLGYYIEQKHPKAIRIGLANEIYPICMFIDETIPFILPKNYNMKYVAEIFKMIAGTKYDQVTYEDTWLKIYNSTTHEYTTFEYNASGFIELLDWKMLYEFMNKTDFAVYRKNSTIIDAGFHSFKLKSLGVKDFNVTLNISVTGTTHLMYSAFDINPMNMTLNYGALFIDVWVNNSIKLNQTNFSPINITINYDPSIYPNMRLYYINTSLNTAENSWIPVDFKNLGNGVIVFTVNYTGIFAFTNAPIPAFLLGDDDDDDDGGEAAPAVPLGNYYLIFLLVGMIGIVLYTKRKILFK